MKRNYLLIIFLAAVGYVTLTANHLGAANQSGIDGIGAETGLGNSAGCSCHGNSATTGIVVTMELDSAGVPVTSYVAGMTYRVKISGVNNTSSTLPKFGFQVGCIQGSTAVSTPTNAGTWITTNLPTNTQYSPAQAGSYVVNLVEQSNRIVATSGTGGNGTTYEDTLDWVAPAAGTGTISFWGVLNAVNGSGSSGDSWNTNHIVITERTITACATTTSSISKSSCSSYNFNGHTLTSSGIYKDTMLNYHGCDSIITLTLNIGALTNSTIVNICNGSSYTFHGKSFNTSGFYNDTLIGTCDTIYSLSLNVYPPITNNISASICTGGSYQFGSRSLTSAGVYTDTLIGHTGCDSFLNLTLNVGPVSANINPKICYGHYFLFHGKTYVSTGIYTDTIISGSCDSIYTINLTVTPTVFSSVNASVCNGNAYLFNGQHYTQPGNYTATLTSYTGCDSTVTLHLNTTTLTVSYYLSGNAIVCNTPNMSYQWFNCVTNKPITGATSQSFIPKVSGWYKVYAYSGNCGDTSSCYSYIASGEENLTGSAPLNVYPNPTSQSIFITYPNVIKTLELHDMIGKKWMVFSTTNSSQQLEIDVHELPKGIYFLRVISINGDISDTKFLKE